VLRTTNCVDQFVVKMANFLDMSRISLNRELLAAFKTYSDSRYCGEYVSAYILLRNIVLYFELKQTKKRIDQFFVTYVKEDSEKQLHFSSELGEQLYSERIYEKAILECALKEIEESLQDSVVHFSLSKEWPLFKRGVYQGRLSETKLKDKRDSDEHFLEHFNTIK